MALAIFSLTNAACAPNTSGTVPSGTPAVLARPALAGGDGHALRVRGNQLVDGSGRVTVLRGVNISGTEFACIQQGTSSNRGWSIYGQQPLDRPATYSAIRAWHTNAVRVPLNEDCWLGINGVSSSYGGVAYRSAIATEVGLIHQAGMYAILDLHWSAWGNNPSDGQSTAPDADHASSFWRSVAASFRSDSGTIFDLFNEPHPHDGQSDSSGADRYGWICWRNGCPMMGGWQSAGMQSLVDAVRSTGATNPVIVNGVGWAGDPSGLPGAIRDPANQLVAGVHSYPDGGCRLPECWTRQNLKAAAVQYPVIIGETGDSAAGPITYMDKELTFADSHGLSYLAWTWNPWSNPDDVLISAWDGTPTAGEGTYYRSHLASLAATSGS